VIAGIAGAAGILRIAPAIGRPARMLLWAGVPLYALIAVVAALPQLGHAAGAGLTGPQCEGILFCLLVLVGTHTAWTAAMAPTDELTPA